MAAYTSETKFLQSVSSDQTWWKSRYNPGDSVPIHKDLSGDVPSAERDRSNGSSPFPPQNHHQHSQQQAIKWQLIVRTDTKGDRFGIK
ncbi:protein L [Klebsiella pneumoniae]